MFEFLKKLLYSEPEQQKEREYLFPLPYKIQAVYLHYGIQQLKNEGVFHRLPEELQHKWTRAALAWHDVRVTAADLDKINDECWTRIADKLNLQWRVKT